jgi:hypothetical protein
MLNPLNPLKTCLCALTIACVTACTAAELTTAKAITAVVGQVCEVVFVSADPALAPLCTTAVELENAIQQAINEFQTTVVDGGVASSAPAAKQHVPANNEVYATLLKRGNSKVLAYTVKK